jgi:hypothetical protein
MTDAPAKVTITIVNKSSILRVLIRMAAVVNGIVLPIGLGVLVDSTAMQWVGFVFGLVLMIGVANQIRKENTVHSFDEARRLLDRMENEA